MNNSAYTKQFECRIIPEPSFENEDAVGSQFEGYRYRYFEASNLRTYFSRLRHTLWKP